MIADIGTGPTGVALISDGGYYSTIHHLITHSIETLFASLFIVDLNTHHDPEAKALQIFHALECAVWRGVDVKLLIGSSESNLAIAEACFIARQVALSHGVDCRLLAGEGRKGCHAKFVIADSWVLSGSHNWSSKAFSGEAQDSVLMASPEMAACMTSIFHSQWERAGDSA